MKQFILHRTTVDPNSNCVECGLHWNPQMDEFHNMIVDSKEEEVSYTDTAKQKRCIAYDKWIFCEHMYSIVGADYGSTTTFTYPGKLPRKITPDSFASTFYKIFDECSRGIAGVGLHPLGSTDKLVKLGQFKL